MEPWDGPASIAFTDGVRVGAVLDRNGLRPSRYYITKDDLVVMASEVGVLDIPPDRVLTKGRLQPGRIFLVDTAEQRLVSDEELKERIARKEPYGEWLRSSIVHAKDLPAPVRALPPDWETLIRRQEVFGYTSEDVKLLIAPMATTGNEAIGSMGTDTPLAVLSERPQPLFNYFQQLFAQVTNPPVDSIREEIDHGLRHDHRAGGQPARARSGVRAPAGAALAHPHQRRAGPHPRARRRAGNQRPAGGEAALALQSQGRRRRTAQRAGGPALEGFGVHRRGLQPPRPLRPRTRRGHGAHPRPAGGLRRAPPSHPRRHAHPLQPDRRERRAARGAPLRAPHRLRRERGESLPRLRDGARPGRAGAHPRPARAGGEEIPEVGGEGHREGDLQDGDQHHPELPRRPGVRGHRALPGLRRRVLHLDRLAGRRRGHRRGGEGSAHAARARLSPQAAHLPHQLARGRRLPISRRRRIPPDQPGDHPQAAARLPHRRLPGLPGVHGADRRPVEAALHLARADGLPRRRPARAHRGSGAGGVDHAPLQDRRDELRLHLQGGARDARGGDEPHRRQVQHRRGRRGSRPVREGRERRLEELRHQAGGERAVRRHQQLPGQRARAADQDRPGRQARRGRPASRQ